MTESQLSELKCLLSGYFHQDWVLEANEPDEVVSRFMESTKDGDELKAIATQIRSFLASRHSEAVIVQDLLAVLGCYYLPSADGMSASAWLRKVADQLSGNRI